jgi:hypothetical protein
VTDEQLRELGLDVEQRKRLVVEDEGDEPGAG